MNIETIVIHKGVDYHCAFPSVLQLQNGDLVTVFREAPLRPGAGLHLKDEEISHHHVDPGTRTAMVRSTDDGNTWGTDNKIVVHTRGLSRDIGYPTSIQLRDDRILTVYYLPGGDGIRFIAGSIHTV